ncbi:intraflagellar transport protein 57 homolog [Patella vulgata]|uniref:intraflagellar transport protein 57 homolog n=1 Tax=Patella vulgata TaxID=6465 RepID=UPI00217F86A3|nr:intraflagellar transport protein 57 homolog [Patella vulgata]
MAEDKKRGDDGDELGPGQFYEPFIQNEELMDKLSILDCGREFIRKNNLKPISKHYFAIPTNPGEQFYMFTSLSAWLLRKSGKTFEQPQEYDDPNATISSLLDEVRKFNYKIDFPPSKLKQGCGEQCLYVLSRLSDEAIKYTGFKWKKPVYPEEEVDEQHVVEDENELTLNTVDDTPMFDDVEEDFEEEDEPIMDLEGMKHLNRKNAESTKPEEILESNQDAADWKLEVERVMPQLKVTIRTDNKDWRVHLDQMHQHKDGIETSLTETKTYLDKLHDEISRTLEKIGSREKYLNSQLEHLLHDFRNIQEQSTETKERYRQASGGVTERSRILAEVTEELEKIKSEMEDRGSSMTDGAPLVKIKQAIQQIKKESTQMDIRIGVVEHVLLQAKLKDKATLSKQTHDI